MVLVGTLITIALPGCGVNEQIRDYEKVEVLKMKYIKRSPGAKFVCISYLPSYLITIKELKPLNEREIVPAEMIGGPMALTSKIVYPELAKRAGIEGLVTLEFDVNKKGQTQKIVLIKGIGGTCDETAINALQSVIFRAAKLNNTTITSSYSISIQFEIPAEIKDMPSVIPKGFDWGRNK